MGKIANLWKSIWSKNFIKSTESIELKSIDELNRELKATRDKKVRTKKYIDTIKSEREFASQYASLGKEEILYLEQLSGKAKEIEDKKANLKGRLVKNNAALARVAQHEEEIPIVVTEMRSVENRRKEIESHIFYLQEEQLDLYEEREMLILAHKFLKGFTAFIIMAMVIVLIMGAAFIQLLRENAVFLFTAVSIIMVFCVIGIIWFNDLIDKALNRNAKLQKKVVIYLNKSKIRLFNQVRYLEYEYNRLGVDSTAKLEMYYNTYLKNKNNEKIYLKMNDDLTDIEEEMIQYLNNKGVNTDYIESFSEWMLSSRKLNQIKQVVNNYDKAMDQLKGLEKYEEEILKEIEVIKVS